MNPEELLGKTHSFDDGNVISVIQIKNRDSDDGPIPYITYQVHQGTSLPRKLVMKQSEFIDTYGHLFGYTNEYTQQKNIR